MTTIVSPSTEPDSSRADTAPPFPDLAREDLHERIRKVLNRRACVGLAIGVIRNDSLDVFHGHGLADLGTGIPITEDTVFRIASITKTVTAVAVMQLWEEGRVDLDAPANEYLRAFRLAPRNARFAPATLRHLLTHTAGVPEAVHLADLVHPAWGPMDARPIQFSVAAGAAMPALSEYYRNGLPVVVEPGTAFAYTNHGFAALGQLVEDVTGQSLEMYLRERVFEPLGMTDTELGRSARLRRRLATGYVVGRRGPEAVPDRDWIGAGADGIYSSTRDLARYVAAILGGGTSGGGSILQPATLATMFSPQYQPDARLPGMGLGFFRSEHGAHLVVGHDGVLPGFNSVMVLAPDDGVGVIGLTNGASGAFTWLPTEMGGLLDILLGVPEDGIRTNVAHRPEGWGELCGRYRLPPRVSDVRGRLAMPGGVEVFVLDGRLMARLRSPLPALAHPFALYPDDEADPDAFRADLSALGMGSVRVVFEHDRGVPATAVHTDLQSLSLYRQPEPRAFSVPACATLGTLAVGGLVAARRRRRRTGPRPGRSARS